MLRSINVVAQILLIIGGLNWGLVGLFQFNLVAAIFGGDDAAISRIIYVIVGAAALYGLYLLKPVSQDTGRTGSTSPTHR